MYGIEAQRIVQDSEETRVMVRYPESERETVGDITSPLITAPNGSKIPLMELSDITLAEGVNEIYREDGNRTITVWATLDYDIPSLAVANSLAEETFPGIRHNYPRVNIEEAGNLQEERQNASEQIRNTALILLPIYLLLALPLRS